MQVLRTILAKLPELPNSEKLDCVVGEIHKQFLIKEYAGR